MNLTTIILRRMKRVKDALLHATLQTPARPGTGGIRTIRHPKITPCDRPLYWGPGGVPLVVEHHQDKMPALTIAPNAMNMQDDPT